MTYLNAGKLSNNSLNKRTIGSEKYSQNGSQSRTMTADITAKMRASLNVPGKENGALGNKAFDYSNRMQNSAQKRPPRNSAFPMMNPQQVNTISSQGLNNF